MSSRFRRGLRRIANVGTKKIVQQLTYSPNLEPIGTAFSREQALQMACLCRLAYIAADRDISTARLRKFIEK